LSDVEGSEQFKLHLNRVADPNRANVSLNRECGLGAVRNAASSSFIAFAKNVLLPEYKKTLAAHS